MLSLLLLAASDFLDRFMEVPEFIFLFVKLSGKFFDT